MTPAITLFWVKFLTVYAISLEESPLIMHQASKI